MKTTIAALAVILSAGSLLAGEKVEINGEFKQLNPEKTAPAGWVKNYSGNPDIGLFEVVPARDKDENAVRITTTKVHTPIYTAKSYPVKPGDTVKMEADVKGNGSSGLYVYLYDKTGFIVTRKLAGGKVSPDNFAKHKGRFTVEQVYKVKRKGETVETVPTAVRFVFAAFPNSEIVFENVEAEIESEK
jgi:hypothetical protein